MTLSIPAKERGRLHLFALNSKPEDPPKNAPDLRPAAILGIDLNPAYAEIVEIKALEDMRLSAYLAEGYDVSEDALTEVRARLNALEGHVLIALSLAFYDAAQQIGPSPGYTYIASLPTAGADWSENREISAQSAVPHSAPKQSKKRPSEAAMKGRIATYVLLLLFAFTGLLIWIAS